MKIIPVLDVLDGITVHAVKGRRKEYRPLQSVICTSSAPLDVALTFASLGFRELYIADLNSIMGTGNNFPVLERIAEKADLRIIADAGVSNIEKARQLVAHGVSNVIIGTETLTYTGFVKQAVCSLGSDRVTVSLDMKKGVVLEKLEGGKSLEPYDLILEFQEMGVDQVIVLDLARVGSEEGVDLALLSALVRRFDLKVFAGGGVRDLNDLIELRKIGVTGVLLATALHNGSITVEDLFSVGLMAE